MTTFVYRCPKTGMKVQGWVADDPTARADDAYEAVACTICKQTHLVNPNTGKVLGSDKD